MYSGLADAAARRLASRRRPSTSYIPHAPYPRQAEFLALDHILDVGYGGAAGGGKSDALLMAMLAYVDRPGYAALILRRTCRELARAGALMHRARTWLESTDAKWRPKDRAWEFPSGARLEFGFCQHAGDLKQYKSAEYAAIGIDQAEDWPENEFEYFFTRTRAPDTVPVPWRFRCTFNPGGVGRYHLEKRYLQLPLEEGTAFVRSARADNASMDAKYGAVLAKVKGVEGQRMRDGDFDAEDDGGMFDRTAFRVVDVYPRESSRVVRFWDLAASDPVPGQKLPDWTRGVRVVAANDRFFVTHVASVMGNPGRVEDLIRQTAQIDGPEVAIRIEQEKGAAGKTVVAAYQGLLRGFDVQGVPASGEKRVRVRPYAGAVQDGRVSILRATWNEEFLDEHGSYPSGRWDDQVIAAAGAFNQLAGESDEGELEVEGEERRTASLFDKSTRW